QPLPALEAYALYPRLNTGLQLDHGDKFFLLGLTKAVAQRTPAVHHRALRTLHMVVSVQVPQRRVLDLIGYGIGRYRLCTADVQDGLFVIGLLTGFLSFFYHEKMRHEHVDTPVVAIVVCQSPPFAGE